MSASPSGLDLLVTELAAKVAALTLEVHSLKERVMVLEQQLPTNSARSTSSFSVVDPPPSERHSSTPPQRGAGYCVGSDREQLAREIGRWLRRALEGHPRGPSGRDQIKLASRFYVVCRDIDGVVHNPPLLFETWRAAKAVCFRQGEPGDAVFVGLPTKTEVEIAVRAAELQLPAALGRQ